MKNRFRVMIIYPNCMMATLLPLSISILSACLKENNFEVELFDTTFYKTESINFEKKKEQLLQVKPFDLNIPFKQTDIYEDLKNVVNNYKPDLICISLVQDTIDLGLSLLESIKDYECPVIAGGVGVNFNTGKLLENENIDILCRGEGEVALVELCNAIYNKKEYININNLIIKTSNQYYFPLKTIFYNPLNKPIDLNTLPYPDFDIFEENRINRVMHGKVYRMIHVELDRGCPFQCLEGEALINTIDGMIPIKNLVGKKIKVLTYNSENNEVLFVDAIHIRKTNKNVQLVRVHFDDNTFIDCTPDHRFKKFINGNQFVDVRENIIEAQDLKPKDSVRAVKYSIDIGGYNIISWRRRERRFLHRLILESKLNRKLKLNECVHHIDGNKNNNVLNNLALTDKNNHTPKFHPEVSKRMKKNNPAKNMTQKWRDKISKTMRGKKLSEKHKKKLSLAAQNMTEEHKKKLSLAGIGRIVSKETRKKISEANKGQIPWNKGKKLKDPNHKVVKVEWLEDKKDVYCMEIPKYHWFYANNVLVHNCTYCEAPAIKKMYSEVGYKNYYRRKTVDRIIDEIKFLKNKYKPDYIDFSAESFIARPENELKDFSKRYKNEIDIPFWCQGRTESVTENKIKYLKEAGVADMQFGIEHGNEDFRKKWLNRKGSNEQILKALGIIEKYEIPYTVNNIIGWPDETRELVFDTVELNRKINPKTMNCYMMTPYRGTWIHKYCLENGLIDEDTKTEQLLDGADIKYRYMTKEQFKGLQRTFSLYVKFNKWNYADINIAEKFDNIGNNMFEYFRKEFIKRYYS